MQNTTHQSNINHSTYRFLHLLFTYCPMKKEEKMEKDELQEKLEAVQQTQDDKKYHEL